ncbi:MAG: CHAT domain-containing protein [Candidatus Viridilinea halotolerans]|uniref:CHAT domain-containing protein n=1 Tax=Candidatus Viridilinea halotolerans TaxID=2491704 RepID=A0A426U4S2_9CHLR|nr:MAG: CHAT domain-containing protein [Candidatus Viridilinea halotolerans]
MKIYAHFELSLTLLAQPDEVYRTHLRIRQTDGTVRELPSARFVYDDELRQQLLIHGTNDESYGIELGKALLSEPLLSELERALGVAESHGDYLCFNLAIDRDTPKLQALHWEKLCHPATGRPLATDGRIAFSRFLSSASGRPIRRSLRHAVRALAAVAAPDNATTYGLSEFKASDYLELAQATLGTLALDLLGSPNVRTSIAALMDRLRSGLDVLYLVAHGKVELNTAYLYLEQADGCIQPLEVAQLAHELTTVPVLPRIVVLASCQSASPEIATSLATIFGEAGVPAVIAMQGNLTLETAQIFMQALLHAIANNEPVDAAMAAGRRAALTAKRADWWMPALFSRFSDGRLWLAEDLQLRSTLEQWLRRCEPSLARNDLAELASHLMACPSMGQLAIAELPDLTTLCVELTFWDADHPEAIIALDTLLEALGLLTPVTRNEILELRHLLGSVRLAESDLDYLYGRIRPDATWQRPTGRDTSDTLRLIVQQLATARVQMPEVQHPLVNFIRLLVDTYPQHVHALMVDLVRWEQQLTARLGLQPRPVITALPLSPSLLIQLTLAPGGIKPDVSRPATVEVLLDAWLFPDLERPLAIREPGTLATVMARLTQLVHEAQQSTTAELWVEFLLPHEIIHCDVDQWCIELGSRIRRERPIGKKYPVVVRSLDRIEYCQREAHLRLRWQERWQQLQNLQANALDQAIITVDMRAVACIDRVERDLGLDRNKEKVILLLTAFTTDKLDDLFVFLDLALEFGLPAVLLTRRGCGNPSDTAHELKRAIADDRFENLPYVVKDQRTQAEAEDHIGHALTLLWDNPQRIPPSMVYRNNQL